MIHIITMAGDGKRFLSSRHSLPKPLIKINEEHMFVLAARALPDADRHIFVVKWDHLYKYDLNRIINNYFPGSEIIPIKETLPGQAFTLDHALKNSEITDNEPFLVSCCDYQVFWNKDLWNKANVQTHPFVWAVRNNKSFMANPASYSWINNDNSKFLSAQVKSSIIKETTDRLAIVGTFTFPCKAVYHDAFDSSVEAACYPDRELYIDDVLNKVDVDIQIFEVEDYICWGNPQDLDHYENRILGRG